MSFPHEIKFDFNNLFTLEMANNHQGSVEHGKAIISEMGKIAREFGIKAAVKLQFRDLDTFIHPDFKEKTDIKHVPRFMSTRLTREQFAELVAATRAEGLITMSTPFDESSVDFLNELNLDIIKIGSCSAQDWPLLEKVASLGKPVIISVGGLTLREVDRVVSFFTHRGTHFALMHCVAIYPTPSEKLSLSQISLMRDRYPNITIGYSTHEPPENTTAIGLAYALGARIFEKHVGIANETIKLNSYSANPEQVRNWVAAYVEAMKTVGEGKERVIENAERDDLKSLMRGVYTKIPITKGMTITNRDVFFAMPLQGEHQMVSGQFKEGLVADRDYAINEAIDKALLPQTINKKDIIYSSVHEVKAMLNAARIPLSHDFTVEISHHYGIEHFREVGCMIINCINREYAKKLIVQLPGQYNPVHFHKLKDETFQVLHGVLETDLEGRKRVLYPGDTLWVPRGVWHSFRTDTGVIFEEISTTAMENVGDSFYIDTTLAKLEREKRKTHLSNWGRYQFDTF